MFKKKFRYRQNIKFRLWVFHFFRPFVKIPNIALSRVCWILANLYSVYATPLIFILKNRAFEPIKNEHFSFKKVLKQKNFLVNLGFFFGQSIHFACALCAYCACVRGYLCSGIARPPRYWYACMEYPIAFNVFVIILFYRNFFVLT